MGYRTTPCAYPRIASTNDGRPNAIPTSFQRRTARLSSHDFCRLYGIGRSGVYKLLKEGKLPSVIVAGRRLIPRDAAVALLRDDEK